MSAAFKVLCEGPGAFDRTKSAHDFGGRGDVAFEVSSDAGDVTDAVASVLPCSGTGAAVCA